MISFLHQALTVFYQRPRAILMKSEHLLTIGGAISPMHKEVLLGK